MSHPCISLVKFHRIRRMLLLGTGTYIDSGGNLLNAIRTFHIRCDVLVLETALTTPLFSRMFYFDGDKNPFGTALLH